jgi:hypothetical protein
MNRTSWIRANCRFAADFNYDRERNDLWAEVLKGGRDVFKASFGTENNDHITDPFATKIGDNEFVCQAWVAGGDWECPVLYYRCQAMNRAILSFGTEVAPWSGPYFVFIPGLDEGNTNLKRHKGKLVARHNDEDCREVSERKGRAALRAFLAKCIRDREKENKN